MGFINRFSPFQYFDHTHPLTSYVIRDVRGGRTPEGLFRYSVVAAGVLWLFMFVPWLLLLTWGPTRGNYYNQLEVSWVYTGWMLTAGLGLFIIADLVAVFYTVVTVRGDMSRDVKYDLLRISLVLPEDYVKSRLLVAQARAWRVFVVVWAFRAGALVLLAVNIIWGLVYMWLDEGLTWADIFNSDALYAIIMVLISLGIAVVMYMAEPLWRFYMLTTLAASVAARVRSAALMWLFMGGALLLVLVLQGAFASAVTWLGVLFYRLTYGTVYLLTDGMGYDLREQVGFMFGAIPYMLMPPIVYTLQTRMRDWRMDVAQRFVFRGGDH